MLFPILPFSSFSLLCFLLTSSSFLCFSFFLSFLRPPLPNHLSFPPLTLLLFSHFPHSWLSLPLSLVSVYFQSLIHCSAGDLGSIPELERSLGEGKGYPFQYSGLENSMDCIVHKVTNSLTQLSNFHFHMSFHKTWVVYYFNLHF